MDNPVVFVSLGPGEAELITLKGWKALQHAEVIFCPGVLSADGSITSRAHTILSDLWLDLSRIVLFGVPMCKDRTVTLDIYRQAANDISQHYRNGKKVALVAEGDCGFYSSIQYIWEELVLGGIPLERIAGVPAFIACGAMAGLHIVSQEEELDVIPGTLTLPELMERLEVGRTVVVMKPSQCEAVLKEALLRMPDVAFHYFENVGVKSREFYTCDTSLILEKKFPYFSLLIIIPNR